MYRDTREELERLESALLADEDTPDIPGEDNAACQSFASGYKAYNSDKTDADPEVYSRALLRPQKRNRGLILPAVFLMLCIGAVAVYWLMRLWGLL